MSKRDFSSIAFLSLGSNLGNRFNNIFKACNEISNFSKITKTSQLYYSPCININNEIERDEKHFINGVLKIETELDYKKLLIECKKIEKVIFDLFSSYLDIYYNGVLNFMLFQSISIFIIFFY